MQQAQQGKSRYRQKGGRESWAAAPRASCPPTDDAHLLLHVASQVVASRVRRQRACFLQLTQSPLHGRVHRPSTEACIHGALPVRPAVSPSTLCGVSAVLIALCSLHSPADHRCHGAGQWRAEHDRRALLYRFNPGHAAYTPGLAEFTYPDWSGFTAHSAHHITHTCTQHSQTTPNTQTRHSSLVTTRAVRECKMRGWWASQRPPHTALLPCAG